MITKKISMVPLEEEQWILHRLDRPTIPQICMALIPALMTFFSSICMLWFAYEVKGTPTWEPMSPIVSTILSVEMLAMCLLEIMYPHHEQYELFPFFYKIIIRMNLFHVVVCASFISYVKMGTDNYTTYFTWLCVITIPITILSIVPYILYIYS